MSKGHPADSSDKISEGELQKTPAGKGFGKPFAKGQSGNPTGRPGAKGEHRARARETADALLLELQERRKKLTFNELMAGIADASVRGGCNTDAQQVEIDAHRMAALGATLDRAMLSTEQRTSILENYQAHLKTLRDE